LAEELHDLCLDENPPESEIVVPVLIDMKMYRGNLLSLIEGSLPTGILEALLQRKWKIKVFLDSFNEMPREHSETVGYEADLTRVFRDIEMSIVIASRTSDGLSNFGFPAYCLDHIDADYLKAELSRRSVSIGGRFENEILRLLQKPFYFHLFIKNEMTLSGEPHPREIFQSFFSTLLTKYHERFSSRIRLMNCLQQAAYSSIEQGQEAWPIQYLLHVMRDDASESGETTDFTGIANWLVSQEILIPYTGARVAFFHQSVTEYLAASEAARLFRLDARSLAAKLAFTRWDQALYLTLSLLPLESSNEFLDEIIRADYIFALNATKYLEFDRDMVVSRLLEEMLKQSGGDFDTSHKIANALRELPVTTVHVEPLRRVMSTGNMLGAAAAGRLVELLGDEIKDELIRTLYERREDFNYCVNGVAPALLSRMSADDLPKVQAVVDMAMIEVNPLSSEETCHGLTHGVAALLREMDLEKITVAFLPESEAPIMEIRARILCDLARDRRSTEGLQLAAELLLRGVKRAATAIFFILEFRGAETIDFSVLDKRHVDRLIVAVQDRSSKDWPQRALTGICLVRADLREIVMAHAESATGLLRVALLVASGAPTRWDALWQELAQITQPDIGGPPAADWNLLHEIDIDWTGHEKLFVDLLKRRDSALAPTLIDNIEDVGELDFGSIDWILEWLDEERTKNHHFMLYDRMSRLIEEKARPAIREAFLSEFNSNKSKYLSVLASSILLARSDLTTDMLSENAISFLLARLGNADDSNFRESLLTRCATETFVEDKLLGLLSNTTEPFYSNLLRVLDSAGRRHGRRYIRS
jgi:hypothetical protein